MGPIFKRSIALTANGNSQPLQLSPAWAHRFLSVNSLIEFVINCTDVNAEFEVTLGSSTEVQRQPVSGGGTAGVFLSFQDNKGTIVGAAGDELAFTVYEIAGGTPTYNVEVHLTPT